MSKNNKNILLALGCALLITAAHTSHATASERGLFDTSSLSGLSDLVNMLTGDGALASSSNSSSSSSSGQDAASGFLQEILEQFGLAGEIPIKDVTVSKIGEKTYTGKEIRPVPKLTYNGKTLKRGTDKSSAKGMLDASWKKDTQSDGYQLEYATNKTFSNSKKKQITNGNTITLSISGLNSGKTYYVRVRAYKKGSSRNSYGPWSTEKSCKVK